MRAIRHLFRILNGQDLLAAIESNDVQLLRDCLKCGVKNHNDPKKRHAVILAALRANSKCVQAFVEEGGIPIDYVDNHDTVLTIASEEGHLDLIRDVVALGAKVNGVENRYGRVVSPLWCSIRRGRTGAVTLLLDLGADVNLGVDPSIPNEPKGSPIVQAVLNGHVRVAEVLVERGATVTDQIIECALENIPQGTGYRETHAREELTTFLDSLRNDARANTIDVKQNHSLNNATASSSDQAPGLPIVKTDVPIHKALRRKCISSGGRAMSEAVRNLPSSWQELKAAQWELAIISAITDKKDDLLAEILRVCAPLCDLTQLSNEPLVLAGKIGSSSVLALLLKCGLKPKAGETSPIVFPDMVSVCLKYGLSPNHRDEHGATPLMNFAWLGDVVAMDKLLRAGAPVDDTDFEGKTALMIASWTSSRPALDALLAHGADVNKVCSKGRTPLHWACCGVIDVSIAGKKQSMWKPARDNQVLLVVERLLAAGNQIDAKTEDGRSPFLMAAFWGYPAVVQLLADRGANCRLAPAMLHDLELFASDAANQTSKEIAEAIQASVNAAKGLQRQFRIELGRSSAESNASKIKSTLSASLYGLVGIDELMLRLEFDLGDFFSGNQSMGRLLHGDSGTGKSEIAQRLSGLREGLPGLAEAGISCGYISGVDGKFEVRKLVEEVQAHSVVFIDEADKCLDPKAGMVSEAEATQLQHAIVTHFSRKPIYWCFVGTFAATRNAAGGELSMAVLDATLGRELASRLDFADWCLPKWTLENLLRAVKSLVAKRGLQYEDDALLTIAEHCLASGGAVRAFENIDRALDREAKIRNDMSKAVTRAQAQGYLDKLTRRAA
jgi:ankyrin repeat protein